MRRSLTDRLSEPGLRLKALAPASKVALDAGATAAV